ncbi:MAG: hypothetical protein EHM36_07600 [Deltaproteobacteria bacterium]|nr:MAG: hypothetical protein EHM36_07600 [Deltaproteobacteria bacterium]
MAPGPKEDKRGKLSIDLVLDLYSTLLVEIWEIVSSLIGEAILSFLFSLAIQKLKGKHPFLSSLKVTEEGISWNKIREDSRLLSPVDVHRGFQSLINHLFHLFSVLAEGVISRELFPKVFPKVKEAERILFPK